MTVFNRSNDLIWGTLGANVVHFSFLQEYVACCLGVSVGRYYQVSDNQHVYKARWTPDVWMENEATRTQHDPLPVDYPQFEANLQYVPLVANKERFDDEVASFVELNKQAGSVLSTATYEEPFLNYVAQPMCLAFHMHKERAYSQAMYWTTRIRPADWRIAASVWITRRQLNWETKQSGSNQSNPGDE